MEGRNETHELAMDDKATKGFTSWFNGLPQDPQIVRFFDRKGFYSTHGANALHIARAFHRTAAALKYLGGSGGPDTGLPTLSLNRSMFEQVLRELLVEGAQHSVEVYEGYGATNWVLSKRASPGRLQAFDDLLARGGDGGELPPVCGVALGAVDGQRVLGAAILDPLSRQLWAVEFVDDDALTTLEAILVQTGAREVVVPKEGEGGTSAADARRLRDCVARVGALSSERPKASFATKHLEQDLGRLVKSRSVEQHRDVLERPTACSALAALIAFTELLAEAGPTGGAGGGDDASDAGGGGRRYGLALYDTGKYMRLDAAAQRALNVMPTRMDANASFSLYGLLNRARTNMGKRRLKAWLKQPLVRVEEIAGRHDAVESMVTDPALREGLRDALRGMPDIERITRKLDAKKASLSDLCQLYRASCTLPRIEEALRSHEGDYAALLASSYAEPLATAHNEEHLSKFEALLEAAIDLDRVPEEYLIAPQYDPRLQELRADKDAVEEEIQALANAAAKDLGLVMDKTIKLEWHRAANKATRCLRITQKEEKAVRSKLQAKYQLLETRKDGTKFTNKALRAAAERLGAAAADYEGLQKDLVAQVVGVAHTFVEVWESVVNLIAELDVLTGFAELAVCDPARPYVRPVMLPPEGGELVLENSRHPCVEAQEGVAFVPNDCRLVKGSSWFQIITGPNMGGKSTYIRQVGAIVLMAQVGAFVPCDSARIAARDAIFARVGAGDCQLRGVSTFMAEMLETAAILKGATPRSLVIIDELGRGTSTYDGFGLAWAISEYLMHAVGAPCLFATHFHELTELEGPGGVANLHVGTRIDPMTGKLTMLYQIQQGACDQSFGIHVAETASFPASVVEAAKKKLAELEGTGLEGTTAAAAAAAGGGKRKRGGDTDGEGDQGGDGDAPDAPAGQQELLSAKRRVAEFLGAFAAMPLGALPPAECAAEAGRLLKGLEADAAQNPVLRRFLV